MQCGGYAQNAYGLACTVTPPLIIRVVFVWHPNAADMFADDENDDTKAESHDEQILLVVEGDEYWDGHECHVECKVA